MRRTRELMACESCGIEILRASSGQRYCPPCSHEKDQKRRGSHPERAAARTVEAIRAREVGFETSEAHAETILVDLSRQMNPRWSVRVVFPFENLCSKNAIWSLARGGSHVFIRREVRRYREAFVLALKNAMRGHHVFENKVWIEIFVQKPNHKGDAVNVVDTVCDVIKEAIGVDDRWFSIKRLDWQIVKREPCIIVGLSQEDCFDARSCHRCGRVLPLTKFRANRTIRGGVGRECHDCYGGRVISPGLRTHEGAV